MEVQEILQDLGYRLRADGNGWRTAALYRNGDNPSSLKIYSNGSFCDFVTNQTGDFTKLISLTTGQSGAKFLQNKKFEPLPKPEKTIEQPTSFPNSILSEIYPEHQYANKRGISSETCRLFKSGEVYSGKMAGRYVFPVFDRQKIIGLAGRSRTESNIPWKILGKKRFFTFPLAVNEEEIRKSEKIVLTESIFDALSLYDVGIKEVFVLFGLSISSYQVMSLARLGVKNITIALNNDQNGRGQSAANKLFVELSRYFDKSKIKMTFPKKSDWNELLLSQGGKQEISNAFNV